MSDTDRLNEVVIDDSITSTKVHVREAGYAPSKALNFDGMVVDQSNVADVAQQSDSTQSQPLIKDQAVQQQNVDSQNAQS